MVSLEPNSSPRISFSADFLNEEDFISITPADNKKHDITKCEKSCISDFEFLSSNANNSQKMLTADELFFEGKLMPFWQMQHSERLSKISLKPSKDIDEEEANKEKSKLNSWFIDDDPSPRPPTCTVLWKELLRLKKNRASSLSPSSSSSSSSSANSLVDMSTIDEGKEKSKNNKEKLVKRNKKGLERTRSASIRIRPMVNVPICSQGKSNSLPPLFPLRKGRFREVN